MPTIVPPQTSLVFGTVPAFWLHMERRIEPVRSELLAASKARIARRLAKVCDGMSAEELDELVTRMATIEIKYALRRRDDMWLSGKN